MTGYCTCVVRGTRVVLATDSGYQGTPALHANLGIRLNMVEIITRQPIRRNTHRSVMGLTAAIGTLIYGGTVRAL